LAIKKIIISGISQKITVTMLILIFTSSIIIGIVISIYSGKMFRENSYTQIITIEQQVLKNINVQLDAAMKQFMFLEIDHEFTEIAQSSSEMSMPAQFTTINHLFEKYKMQQPDLIDSIFFYRYEDGELFSPYTYDTADESFDRSFLKRAESTPMKPVWAYPGIKVNASHAEVSDEYISIIKDVNDCFETFGVLVFNLKMDKFREIFGSISMDRKDFKMMIVDKNNNILLSEGNIETEEFDLSTHDLSKATTEFMRDRSLFVCSPVTMGGFTLVSMFSGDMITRQSENIANYIIYCVVLSVLVFVAIAYLISQIITRPLTLFTKAIHPAIEGNYAVHFDYSHDDEIGTMVNTYNVMVDRTQKLIEQIKSEQELKSKAELKALQQQINAHFLYNTLDVIYWLSKNGDGEKAAEITASLSEMLRISVSNGKEIIPVCDETVHLEKYLIIQKFRYDFVYSININPEILDYSIPKLILQPIAENAVLHGFEDIDYQGELNIIGFAQNRRIVFEITDNGCGFDLNNIEQKPGTQTKGTKYALKNMDTRFKLIYGDGEYMKIMTAPGEGTKVIISLPII